MDEGTFVTTSLGGHVLVGGHMSGGKIRTLVQILHFGAGESLVTARWLSGFTIQMRGFRSGPSRAKEGKQSRSTKEGLS